MEELKQSNVLTLTALLFKSCIMRVVYLLSILLCSHAFSHPSKRQDQADGALDEWFLPPLDWPDTDFEGQSVGEPARRDPSGNTGPEKDDSAELDTSPKAIGCEIFC